MWFLTRAPVLEAELSAFSATGCEGCRAIKNPGVITSACALGEDGPGTVH
jgi:hypothetical protein